MNADSTSLQAELKLRKLASTPFVVLGEVRVVDGDFLLSWIGDEPPESRLGMAPGTFPTSLQQALAIVHPDDAPNFQQGVEASLATGQPLKIVCRMPDGQGGWRWIEGRAVPVTEIEGHYPHWVYIARDCTGQRESELALRRTIEELETSRHELRTEKDKWWRMAANAFSMQGEGRVTEDGMELGFFGDVSPETKASLLPGSVSYSSTRALISSMHPEDVVPFKATLERSIKTGEPIRVAYRLKDGRGGWRWFQARGFSIEEREGQHVRWLHDTLDITEQKELEIALRRTVTELEQLKAKLQVENQFLRQEVGLAGGEPEIVGWSPAITRVLQQVALVAPTASTVLIGGETGTGKELVARAIHRGSARQRTLFVAVNCAALPETLVESELFGHEKGAFTGAISRRIGRFQQADGGTLFLDEVGELPLETQAKMLRVLQSGEFERVGGNQLLKSDVRIIAASNRDLEQAVHDGRFRSDLYHRLAVFPIQLPPLRERPEDIPLLATYLVTCKAKRMGRRIDEIPKAVLDRLVDYDWPGNVRELENVLERAIILSPGTALCLEAVQLRSPLPVSSGRSHHSSATHPLSAADDTLRHHERQHILRVCAATGWRIKGVDGAASRLGLNPATLYSRMKKLGIQRPTAHP